MQQGLNHTYQYPNQQMAALVSIIDRALDDPADRMVIKLVLDGYELDEIARFSGEPRSKISVAIERIETVLERHAGCFFSSIKNEYISSKAALLYG